MLILAFNKLIKMFFQIFKGLLIYLKIIIKDTKLSKPYFVDNYSKCTQLFLRSLLEKENLIGQEILS